VALRGFSESEAPHVYAPQNSTIPDIKPDYDPYEQLTLLNLGGNHGDFFWGNVIKSGLPVAQYQRMQLHYQTGFTSPVIELLPTFVPNLAAIPAGQEGFYLVGIPEPSTLALIASALLAWAISVRPSMH
jgi:hypothetical protein